MEVKNKREDLFTKDLPPIIGAGGAGFTADVLWSGDVTSDELEITDALANPITDYVFLTANQNVNGAEMSGGMLYVPLMGTVSNYILQHNPSLPIKVRLDGNKAYISSTSDVSNVSLIGIK
jgi:hypothetical protein